MTTEFKMPELPEGYIWSIENYDSTMVAVSIILTEAHTFPIRVFPWFWQKRVETYTTEKTISRLTSFAAPSDVQALVNRMHSDFNGNVRLNEYKNRIIGTYPPKETL